MSVRHSTTQYWQSESPPRGCRAAAAIGEPQAQAAKQVKVNLNSGLLRKFKFKFTCKLIPINSSFNVLSHISKLKFKESRGLKVETLPLHMCTGSEHWQAQGRGTCLSYDLGLAASLTCSCRPGVTVFLSRRGYKLRPSAARARRAAAAEEAGLGTCQSYDLGLLQA